MVTITTQSRNYEFFPYSDLATCRYTADTDFYPQPSTRSMETDVVIRVMLVDDHAVVRAGYKRFIETDDKIRIVSEASTGEEAYTQLARIDVDVIILDLSMPGQGGFETLRRIINRYAKKKVLIFSMHENPSIARQALQIGASGYLTKSMDPEKIILAIHEVWIGGTPIEESIAKGITELDARGDPHTGLLPREFEVFLLLSAGDSVDNICKKLNMSSRTVFNYQTTIRKKMNLHTHIEFNRYAIQRGLITNTVNSY